MTGTGEARSSTAKNLGSGLAVARGRLGLFQDELAGRAGVPTAVIARLEAGEPAAASDLQIAAVSRALGLRPDRLPASLRPAAA